MMIKETLKIENIPAILWGEKSDNIYIYVHGKLSDKEEARSFAEKAAARGFQVLSFDLPEHGCRKEGNYPCTVWNGVRDLTVISEYVRHGRNGVCLYGSSLGAYFSLLAYKNLPLEKCLFLSPILDMERLIQNMMKQFGVSERALKEKREVSVPGGEILSWDYYCYVKDHPVDKWNAPTEILCGSEDELTTRDIAESFAGRFSCGLTVLEGGGHWFCSEWQLAFLDKWLFKHI